MIEESKRGNKPEGLQLHILLQSEADFVQIIGRVLLQMLDQALELLGFELAIRTVIDLHMVVFVFQ